MSAHPIREHRALGTTPRRASLRLAPVANLVRLALVGMALATAASAAAQSTTAPVYRCVEPGGRVLYADYPCKGGARVDIRPGVPAPDATERLARARDELDRAAARRQAIDDAAALQRQALNQRQQELDAARYADAGYRRTPRTSRRTGFICLMWTRIGPQGPSAGQANAAHTGGPRTHRHFTTVAGGIRDAGAGWR